MAISQQKLASLANTFGVTNGVMLDAHLRNGGTIWTDALILKKDKDGHYLAVGAVLLKKAHCVNAVDFVDGLLTLTKTALTGGLTTDQTQTIESIVNTLNEGERFMSEVVLGKPQDYFWEPLVVVS